MSSKLKHSLVYKLLLTLLFSLISATGCEMSANDRDIMLKDPVILRPTETKRNVETMDDVSNFPE